MRKQILYLGYGKMGKIVAEQIKKLFFYPAIYIVNTKQNDLLNQKTNLKFDLICFFVKPQEASSLINNLHIAKYIKSETIIFSIMVGKDYNFFKTNLSKDFSFVRFMPNFGMQNNCGIGSIFYKNISHNKQKLITKILSRSSKMITVSNELQIDIFTACFGSGIAFAAYFIDIFYKECNNFINNCNKKLDIDQGKEVTLDNILTLFDSVITYCKQNRSTPHNLITLVASKGGTTEAGLEVLINANINDSTRNCLQSALHRAIKLQS